MKFNEIEGVTNLDTLELARHIVEILEENKGNNIVLLDLRPDVVIADFFVICTGTSDRQLKALLDFVRVGVKEQFNILPFYSDNYTEGGWVVLDYSEVIVHLFLEETREFYDLEGLWRPESNVLLSIQ